MKVGYAAMVDILFCVIYFKLLICTPPREMGYKSHLNAILCFCFGDIIFHERGIFLKNIIKIFALQGPQVQMSGTRPPADALFWEGGKKNLINQIFIGSFFRDRILVRTRAETKIHFVLYGTSFVWFPLVENVVFLCSLLTAPNISLTKKIRLLKLQAVGAEKFSKHDPAHTHAKWFIPDRNKL